MVKKLVSQLLVIVVVFTLNLSVAFSEEAKGIFAGCDEGFTVKSPRDSVDWLNMDFVSKPPKAKDEDREHPGESVGLTGAIITHGGKGKDEAIVVYNPDGVLTGVVTKEQAAKDPETAQKTIEAACSGTTDQSIDDIARKIGEILSPTPIDEDFLKGWKGSGKLGNAAAHLNERYGKEFEWTNDTNIASVGSLEEFLLFRAMSCFEFVCFCAWISGNQDIVSGGGPRIGMAKSTVFDRKTVETWDGESEIEKGKIVAGWTRWPVGDWDHTLGNYYHIGISVGNGYMISLRGGTNLAFEKIEDCFPGWAYGEVKYGDFNWKIQTGTIPEALAGGGEIESVVDHLQPIVMGGPTDEDRKRKETSTTTETKPEQSIEEIALSIGEILSPTDLDGDGKPDEIICEGGVEYVALSSGGYDFDYDGKLDKVYLNAHGGGRFIDLSSGGRDYDCDGKADGPTRPMSTGTAPGIESVVPHLQPFMIGGPTDEDRKRKETRTAPETEEGFPEIKLDLKFDFDSSSTGKRKVWPNLPRISFSYDLTGDGKNIIRPVPPSNYTPDSVLILQLGIAPLELHAISGKLVDQLTTKRRRGGFFDLFPNKIPTGIYSKEKVFIRKKQEVNPNDPLYLRGGGEAAAKKKGGFRLGIGKLTKGATSVASGGGVSFGSGGKSKGKVKDQWALRRVGFKPRINPDSAWNVEDGSKKNVIVAVVDSGLDMNHPDAPQCIWKNPDEIPDNGIDDDLNGYVDDIHGWNFVDNNNDLTDKEGHGTFVSGIIAAKTNNGIGIAGINPGAQIMVLKVVNEKGISNSFSVYRALRYAADKGAKIINISLGEKGVSVLEQLGVNYAYYKGALIVVAAGNQADIISNYGPPALRRVLPVAAMNIEGTWCIISNKGQNMALMAPGEEIYSLHSKDAEWCGPSGDRERLYYKGSGTSFSAPLVAATASLLLAKNPKLTNRRVEDILLDTAKDLREPGWDGYTGAGLLDAYKALTCDPQGILTLRPTELIINKERKKVTSVDLFGIIRGALDSFVVEVGKGKKPQKWEQVAAPQRRQIEYGFIARIDGKTVSRGKEWVVRITATDRHGNTKVAHLPLSLKKE